MLCANKSLPHPLLANPKPKPVSIPSSYSPSVSLLYSPFVCAVCVLCFLLIRVCDAGGLFRSKEKTDRWRGKTDKQNTRRDKQRTTATPASDAVTALRNATLHNSKMEELLATLSIFFSVYRIKIRSVSPIFGITFRKRNRQFIPRRKRQ